MIFNVPKEFTVIVSSGLLYPKEIIGCAARWKIIAGLNFL